MKRILFTSLLFIMATVHPGAIKAAPQITGVTDNRAVYSNSQIPRYQKLEITFQVSGSVATTPQFPYDAAPPAGVTPGTGITVNAVFTSPQGTTFTQPAYYHQNFDYQTKGSQDWLYPTDNFVWKVRFAPHQTGTWQYKLVAQDASPGTAESAPIAFTVTTSNNHGFVRVSSNDSRYFEFDDGTYFPAMGYNMNYSNISWDDPVVRNTANFQAMGQNGIQLIRMWLSQWNIFGSMWGAWRSAQNGAEYDGLSIGQAAPGSEVSMWLNWYSNPAMFWGWMKKTPAVKRSTTYQVTVHYLLPLPLQGPRIPGYGYGLAVKMGGWLADNYVFPTPTPTLAYHKAYTDPCEVILPFSWGRPECYYATTIAGDANATHHITSSPTDTSGNPQWSTFTTYFNSGSQDFMDSMYLTLDNVVTPGTGFGNTAYIDRVEVREVLGNGQFGPNIINKPDMDQHTYFDQRQSAAFDKVVELAETNGVYLRPAILEKNDWIFDRIQANGTITTGASNNNFYGNPTLGSKTRIRWLQEAWWRYLQARWGYSTSIQSWELLNEGDPYHGWHYQLTDDLAKYMHQFVPNHHLANTSFWHSFPTLPFWKNNAYPHVDFADVHQYMFPTDINLRVDDPNAGSSVPVAAAADFFDTALSTYKLSQQIGAKQRYGVNKPVIRGETGLVTGDTDGWIRELQTDTQGIWLHHFIWGHINAGGLIESYWYDTQHIYSGSFDHRHHFGSYYNFIKNIPLNNGRYIDAAPTVSNPSLRVWGQKDTTNKRAHLWIANPAHTWKNVIDAVNITPLSGTVTLTGFTPNTPLPVVWFNTYTGAPYTGVAGLPATLTPNAQGEIVLSPTFVPLLNNLTTDFAVKIGDYTQTPPPTGGPSPTLLPTPTGMPGDTDNDHDVDYPDLLTLLKDFGRTITSLVDWNHNGTIDIYDFNEVIAKLI